MTTSGASPKDWIVRWAISLTNPLYSLRRRNEIDVAMRTFARRMPEYFATVMAGIAHDIVVTVDPADPFRNMYRDKDGVVRLPGGDPFGSWTNFAADLAPASTRDKSKDISLAPAMDNLSDESVELYFHASHSWEGARDHLIALGKRAKHTDPKPDVFEIAEDTVRYALTRRQNYGLHDDGFFHVTADAWAERADKIVAGEPFDESRMLRLRSGSTARDGTYLLFMDPDGTTHGGWLG